MSWQAGAASGPFLVGTMIQAMIYVNDANYSGTNWQGTLFVWAITFIKIGT
jgi:choline transport protein